MQQWVVTCLKSTRHIIIQYNYLLFQVIYSLVIYPWHVLYGHDVNCDVCYMYNITILLCYIIKWVYIQIHRVYNVTTCLQRKDLLQLMIDASDSETQKGLEKGEIIVDSVGFMLGGYDTTSTTLTFATYLLAANPEAQERLANVIHEYFEENPVSKSHAHWIPTWCVT